MTVHRLKEATGQLETSSIPNIPQIVHKATVSDIT
jgi:hypothetical protein